MRTHRISVMAAVSTMALFAARTSFAQEVTPVAPAQPTQPANQTVTVQQPPAQQVQPAPAAAPAPAATPVATTQTTQAAYSPPPSDRLTERSIEHRPNKALLSTGGGIFLLSYGASVVAGAVSDRDADNKLFIPVVGPWMDLNDRGCSASSPCGGNEDTAKAMIITSGVVQGAGILVALSSLIIPESTTVEERSTQAKNALKPGVQVLPMSYQAGAGIGAIGRF